MGGCTLVPNYLTQNVFNVQKRSSKKALISKDE
jgi:hypothetical protein